MEERHPVREVHEVTLCGCAQPGRAETSVVLMDELDQLLTAKQDVVYNFFNWPTMRDSQLFVIAVANRMDLPQHLAAKIKSRLGGSNFRALLINRSPDHPVSAI